MLDETQAAYETSIRQRFGIGPAGPGDAVRQSEPDVFARAVGWRDFAGRYGLALSWDDCLARAREQDTKRS